VISVGAFSASGDRLGTVTGEQTDSRLAEVAALLTR